MKAAGVPTGRSSTGPAGLCSGSKYFASTNEWDFSACDAAGLELDTAGNSPPGDGLATTVDSNGGETHTFILSAADSSQKYDCDALLYLRDQASEWSSRKQTFRIRAGAYDLSLPLICEERWGNCDGDPLNGCETDLTVGPQHCGACGNACDAYEQCMAGACVDRQRAEWPLPPDAPTALSVQGDVIEDALTGLMWPVAPPVRVTSFAQGSSMEWPWWMP